MSLIDRIPRNATVVTSAPTSLLGMDAREFASLIAAQPQLALKVLKTVARRCAILDNRAP
ncbi:MAG: hypothetical protein OEM97_00470 [Acidimicrobiia bacterium]|nr:hypothetical protein [Acidimicrobiia bacterium]